jgi:outer membrane protein OmpA-like peptidoglycan-associated protein
MTTPYSFEEKDFEMDSELDESEPSEFGEEGESDPESEVYSQLNESEESFEEEFAEETNDLASAMRPRSATAYGKEPLGAQTLWGMYESDELFNEGIVSFEYPIYHATDEEMDYFLGKLVRRVSRAARGVAKTAGGVAKGIGRGVNTIGKVVPLSTLTSALAHTPMGFAVRAGLGAVSAAASGRNIFQGAVRSMTTTPLTRFAVDTAAGVARGENILKAAKKAGQAGIGDVRESLRFAAMVAPFVPGIGTGAAAALAAGNALASGERISDALIAAARNAVPGGALAQTAFDMAANLAKGKKLSEAVLDAARSRLPGGPAAKAAFDSALALAKGKSVQDSLIAGGGRLLPKSPYAADVLSFVKKAAAGENLGKAALSSAGNLVMKRIEQQAGPIVSRRVARLPISVQQLRRRSRRVPSLGREVSEQEITMNEQFNFQVKPFELNPEFDESSELFNDELEDGGFDLEADGYAELGDAEDTFEGEFAEEATDPEDFEDFENLEDFEDQENFKDFEFEDARPRPAPAIKGGPASPACEVLDGFDFDKDALKPQHQRQLDAIAGRIIASQRGAQPIRLVKIVGHTDPVGDDKYNLDLGRRRARQIAEALRRTLDRLRSGSSARVTLVPESRGESEPLGQGAAKDRRVQICLPPPTRPKGCPPHKSRIRLHLKILVQPTRFSIATMLRSMRQVYGPAGFRVEVASRETLRLPSLEELDVACPNTSIRCQTMPCANTNLNAEHVALFRNRNNVKVNELAVYFVRRTVPGLNGICDHPPGKPGVVVTARASQWSLAHEIGHALGLSHLSNSDRLMTDGGTDNITNPPPDLVAGEIKTMDQSNLTIPC